MVLTGLPADGKASFCIAPHCGFRYRKRRFYRILMLLARYDGHMNPVFEKTGNHIQIAIDAWSGLRKSRSPPEYVPPYSKKPHSRCAIAVNARKRASKRRSKPKYVPPYPKNRENQSKSLLFINGGRAKTTTNRTRQRKQPIYSIGTASKYCATPVAFAEPADSPDCIAPSKISAAAANSTVSSIKSPLFGANSPFAKP